ncbi:MAG TPA: AzlD domain-containing protein [Anaerolineales bacterium]|jgi:branched-subunit amino acid transport protein
MSSLGLAIVIGGGLLVTYLTRLSFLALIPADRLPAALQRALRYAPPAVLAAIILPTVASGGPGLAGAPHWLAAVAAAIVAWRTGNTWLTILVGMLLLWVSSALIG